MKNKFIMLCGLPGSGKSTLAERLVQEPNTLWVSSDRIRGEINLSESDQSNTDEVFMLMKTRTIEGLCRGMTVIYDATNVSAKYRKMFLTDLKNLAKQKENARIRECITECVICATPYRTCVQRAASRERVVEAEVIKAMYKRWAVPTYSEGWDMISIYYTDGSERSAGTVEDFVEGLMDYSQDNPHHAETLGTHLKAVSDYLVTHFGYAKDSNMAVAGLVHDCGKPYTKSFMDAHHNPCEIAHYYQHQCTGAYDAMFFDYGDKTEEDILEIITLVSLHMNPFSWVGSKSHDKYRKQLGEDLYTRIMQLHEADENSSLKAETDD